MSEKIKRIFFIGIGGVGMSGIARVAHDQGLQVSGSDMRESRYTRQLCEAGIEVFIGHEAQNILDVKPDVVVISTAILENNPELMAAKEQGLEIWHRAKMLAELGREKCTLAIAGTHGKTTSSAMLAKTLDEMGEDPTFVIGGIVGTYSTNARSGTGSHYVVEADESDKSFTYLDPKAILVTNIEADHLDHYNDLEEIFQKFQEFICSLPEDGICVVCGHDESLVEIAKGCKVKFYTYGFGDGFDISISAYEPIGLGSTFSCCFPDGVCIDSAIKQNPGSHNVLNAAGVLGLIWASGLSVEKAAKAMTEFSGVRRRFDLIGVVNNITVIDDYAHHPTEIAATIKAAKQLGYDRVHVLFQPHRYSRVALFTEVLKDEFGASFDDADSVTFMDVYPAGEMPIPGISGKTFMNTVLEHSGHPDATYLAQRSEVVPHFVSLLQPGDMLITMGAGDVTSIGPQLVAALSGNGSSVLLSAAEEA